LTPEEEKLLAEDVELDVDLRHQVLDVHRNLERLDFYALLGVDRTADRKAIKRAYYDLAARFHPDRHFRKRLGSFKVLTEAIFARLTLAHDALENEKRRVEYDAYLRQRQQARTIEDLMNDAVAEIRRTKEAIERDVRGELSLVAPAPPPVRRMSPATGMPRVSPPAGTPRISPPAGTPRTVPSPAPSPAPPAPTPGAAKSPAPPSPSPAPAGPGPARRASPAPPAAGVDVTLAARREALAQRLLGGNAAHGSVRPPPSEPAQPPPMTTAEAMEALKRRYLERVKQAKGAEARKFLAKAEAALKSGDAVQAAAALRVALDLAPDNPDLQRRAAEAQAKADALLGDTYVKQAEYEEKQSMWSEAAASWKRVCQLRPQEATPQHRAAHCLMRAGEDLKEAAAFAKRACELDPKDPHAHVTRANVGLATGDTAAARAALDIAAQLAPQDGTIQAMLRRLGRPE
jgi:tetratricopeptide (TPR) repeat protein